MRVFHRSCSLPGRARCWRPALLIYNLLRLSVLNRRCLHKTLLLTLIHTSTMRCRWRYRSGILFRELMMNRLERLLSRYASFITGVKRRKSWEKVRRRRFWKRCGVRTRGSRGHLPADGRCVLYRLPPQSVAQSALDCQPSPESAGLR